MLKWNEFRLVYCINCGKELPDSEIEFCPDCGAPLKNEMVHACLHEKRSLNPEIKQISYIVAISIVLVMIVSIFFVPAEMNEKTWTLAGRRDRYHVKLRYDDAFASKWKVTITARLTERQMTGFLPDAINIAILRYSGGPSALDYGWHVYNHKIAIAEGDYSKAVLTEVTLESGESYRIGIEPYPKNLSWRLEVLEEWR